MNKKDYFSQLISLYEATNAVRPDLEDQKVYAQQQQIADSGSDINDRNVLPQGQQMMAQPGPEMSPYDNDVQDSVGLDDAAYLNNYSASNDASSTTVSDNQRKLVELFDLLENLLNYSKNFSESIKSIDLTLLNEKDYQTVDKVLDKLNDLSKKLNDYLLNNFEHDAYEKALYAYIIFRTELLTAVKILRDVLKLNEVEDQKSLGGKL